MENNKNKKSVKFQGDMLNFYDFIQVFLFTPNHHLKAMISYHDFLVQPAAVQKLKSLLVNFSLNIACSSIFTISESV